jgi:hypothetical protein
MSNHAVQRQGEPSNMYETKCLELWSYTGPVSLGSFMTSLDITLIWFGGET